MGGGGSSRAHAPARGARGHAVGPAAAFLSRLGKANLKVYAVADRSCTVCDILSPSPGRAEQLTPTRTIDAPRASAQPWLPPVSVPERRESDIHVLLWQVRGTADLVVRGEHHPLTPGHAMWIPAGCRHEFTVHDSSVTMPVLFDVDDRVATLRSPALITIDRDLRTLLLAHVVATSTIVRSHADLARQILPLIARTASLSAAMTMPTTAPALRIAQTLRADPSDVRSVEELAASVHTSVRTIERAFRAETGMTLRRWRIRSRMEAASALLRGHTRPDAVARRVGYTNVNAFRRVFVDHFGMSATEFAARFGSE
jgi:AraC-like DNA-binding protein